MATTAAATLDDFWKCLAIAISAPGSQRYPAGLERFYPNRGILVLIGNLPTIPDLIYSRSILHSRRPSEWLPAPNRGLIVPRRYDLAIMFPLGIKVCRAERWVMDTGIHGNLSGERIALKPRSRLGFVAARSALRSKIFFLTSGRK